MRGYGRGRLEHQTRVPMWGGGFRSSVPRTGQRLHRPGRAHIHDPLFGDINQYRGVGKSSVVTWHRGDLVAKACKTYCVRLAGRCLGMSSSAS